MSDNIKENNSDLSLQLPESIENINEGKDSNAAGNSPSSSPTTPSPGKVRVKGNISFKLDDETHSAVAVKNSRTVSTATSVAQEFDEDEMKSLKDYVVEQIDAWLFQQTNEEFRNLPFPTRYVVAFAVISFAAIMFIVSTNRVFTKLTTKPFVSLEKFSGCEEVPYHVSADYLATTSGQWQTATNFNYNDALFQFSFVNYDSDNSKFYQDMITMLDKVNSLGEQAQQQNLALNIVLLSAIVLPLSNTDTSLQVQAVVTPNDAFYKSIWIASLGRGGINDCHASVAVFYSRTTATFTIEYEAVPYVQQCANYTTDIFDLGTLGIPSNQQFFTTYLYGRAYVTALAINLNYINANSLEYVNHDQPTEFSYKGVKYYLVYKFLSKFPGMAPVECIYQSEYNTLVVCLVKLGNIVGIPVINHLGNSTTVPEYCDCDNGVGNSANCNTFEIMIGVIYFPVALATSPSNYMGNYIDLILSYNSSSSSLSQAYFKLNRDVYEAQFAVTTNQTHEAWAFNTFEFCNSACALLNILISDTYSLSVSSYYYQLLNGSCNNPLNTENWETLASSPPVSLVQDYYSCTPSPFEAAVESIGIGMGDASFYTAVLTVFISPFIYLLLQARGTPPVYDEYSKEERELALKELAIQLLRVRDDEGTFDENSTVKLLANDLMHIAATRYANHTSRITLTKNESGSQRNIIAANGQIKRKISRKSSIFESNGGISPGTARRRSRKSTAPSSPSRQAKCSSSTSGGSIELQYVHSASTCDGAYRDDMEANPMH